LNAAIADLAAQLAASRDENAALQAQIADLANANAVLNQANAALTD